MVAAGIAETIPFLPVSRPFLLQSSMFWPEKAFFQYWACARALSVCAALWACIYIIVTYEQKFRVQELKKKDKKVFTMWDEDDKNV